MTTKGSDKNQEKEDRSEKKAQHPLSLNQSRVQSLQIDLRSKQEKKEREKEKKEREVNTTIYSQNAKMWPKQQLHHHHVPSSWCFFMIPVQQEILVPIIFIPRVNWDRLWSSFSFSSSSQFIPFWTQHKKHQHLSQLKNECQLTWKKQETDRHENMDLDLSVEVKRESSKCEECFKRTKIKKKKKKEGKNVWKRNE